MNSWKDFCQLPPPCPKGMKTVTTRADSCLELFIERVRRVHERGEKTPKQESQTRGGKEGTAEKGVEEIEQR